MVLSDRLSAKTFYTPPRQVFIVEYAEGRRSFILDAATYSMGRDPTCAIVLRSDYVSRQHAILLRVPDPTLGGYRYRILDGNSSGQASTNGLMINGERRSTHDLQERDVMVFSRDTSAVYVTASNLSDAELMKYCEIVDFRRLKSKTVDPKQTKVESHFKL
ncbi:MAG: FHA domain-containing protein [Cyanobacteria bacterium P01_D01_bin.123]